MNKLRSKVKKIIPDVEKMARYEIISKIRYQVPISFTFFGIGLLVNLNIFNLSTYISATLFIKANK
jgi:hypothetical protein